MKRKLSLSERARSTKYGEVIQPVRNLAIENSGLKGSIRSLIKILRKMRYKKNRQARLIVQQGKYIGVLKARLIEQCEEQVV